MTESERDRSGGVDADCINIWGLVASVTLSDVELCVWEFEKCGN